MNTQQIDSRIVSNWKSPEQSIAAIDDNWSREILLLETDNLAYEEDYLVIDEHIHGISYTEDF